MLYLYIIMLVITGYSVYSLTVKKPLFTIIDKKYQYPMKGSFAYQNCKLDKTCWIKPDKINGIIPTHNPKMSRNYIFVFDKFKTVKLPKQYFRQTYGNQLI